MIECHLLEWSANGRNIWVVNTSQLQLLLLSDCHTYLIHIYITTACRIMRKYKDFRFKNYSITCVKFAISYTGLTDASKGYHVFKTMSWFRIMRTVVWIVWNTIMKAMIYLVSFSMIGMYPAFVKYPVSGFLVGSSSQVKESVRRIRCSTSRFR
jgi:hypothetical protein